MHVVKKVHLFKQSGESNWPVSTKMLPCFRLLHDQGTKKIVATFLNLNTIFKTLLALSNFVKQNKNDCSLAVRKVNQKVVLMRKNKIKSKAYKCSMRKNN